MNANVQQQHMPMLYSSPDGGYGDDGLGELPAGWSVGYDNDDVPYFIDHNSKTTTWYDPRLRKCCSLAHM